MDPLFKTERALRTNALDQTQSICDQMIHISIIQISWYSLSSTVGFITTSIITQSILRKRENCVVVGQNHIIFALTTDSNLRKLSFLPFMSVSLNCTDIF